MSKYCCYNKEENQKIPPFFFVNGEKLLAKDTSPTNYLVFRGYFILYGIFKGQVFLA